MPAIVSQSGFTVSPVANTAPLRDSAARTQFADPAAAQDAATKNYVDGFTGVTLGLPAARVAALAFTTTEVFPIQWTIPANTLAVGTTLRLEAAGVFTGGTSPTGLSRLRIGTAGTTADTSIAGTTASAAAANTAAIRIGGTLTCRTTGTTGTVIAEVYFDADNIAIRRAVATATVTVNTTIQNILSLGFLAAGTTPTGNFHLGYGELIRP